MLWYFPFGRLVSCSKISSHVGAVTLFIDQKSCRVGGGERTVCCSSRIATQNGSSAELTFLHNNLGHIPGQDMPTHLSPCQGVMSRLQCVGFPINESNCGGLSRQTKSSPVSHCQRKIFT